MVGKAVPPADHSIISFEDLTDRELEILRLLASGHTVKTIAVQLGCSEASINERLRDARRKTGTGSSRELARRLDAQKIWDRKIDLPTIAPTDGGSAQPTIPGLKTSKGLPIMLFITPVAIAGLVGIAAPILHVSAPETSRSAAVEAPPLVGNWSLDVSRIPENERPKRVTFAFRILPDSKWKTNVEIVAPDGTSTHAESTAALDGVPVPIAGNMTFADTVALRQPAANTLVMTFARAGAPVSTRVYTVAKDRKSMTETIVWNDSPPPRMATTYFNRIE
jgi:DNA-binding CsgD family transcriptional regulator